MQFETYGVGGRSKGKIFISRNTYAKEMVYKSLGVDEQGMSIEYVERLDHLEFLVLITERRYPICSRCSIYSDRL